VTSTRVRRTVAAIVAAASIAAVPATATAQTTARQQREDSQLVILKARAKAAVDRRETELTRLRGQVSASKRLTPGHRSTLLQQISSASSGLLSVDAKVQADTDLTTARADAQTIVTGFRVFVLVEPRTHLVIAADIETSAANRLATVADKLESAIATAQAKGKDVTAAKAAVADLRTQISTALGKAATAASSVIGLTAAGYPANQPTLTAARDSVQSSRAALKAAVTDARAAVAGLK
jgi:hypothetical protein